MCPIDVKRLKSLVARNRRRCYYYAQNLKGEKDNEYFNIYPRSCEKNKRGSE